MSVESQANALSHLIYDAVLEKGEAWTDLVEAMAQVFDDSAVMLNVNVRGQPRTVYCKDLRQDLAESVVEHTLIGMPFAPSTSVHWMGRFGHLGEAFEGVELERSDFFKNWMKPQGLAPIWPAGASLLLGDGESAGAFGLYRKESAAPLSREHFELGQLLVPHFSRALTFYSTMEGALRGQAALAQMVDRYPVGIVLLDGERQVVFENRAAKRTLSESDGLSRSGDGMRTWSPLQNAILQNFFTVALEAQPGREAEVEQSIGIARPSGRPAYEVSVLRLVGSSEGRVPDEPVIAALIRDDAASPVEDEVGEGLGTLLTASQAELVRRISAGSTLEQAATDMGIPHAVAGRELRNLFGKIGSDQRGDLIRTLLTGDVD